MDFVRKSYNDDQEKKFKHKGRKNVYEALGVSEDCYFNEDEIEQKVGGEGPRSSIPGKGAIMVGYCDFKGGGMDTLYNTLRAAKARRAEKE